MFMGLCAGKLSDRMGSHGRGLGYGDKLGNILGYFIIFLYLGHPS